MRIGFWKIAAKSLVEYFYWQAAARLMLRHKVACRDFMLNPM